VQLLNAYFSLSRAVWIPCVIRWDAETGEFRRVEGPEGFATWEEADEASRFLLRSSTIDDPLDSRPRGAYVRRVPPVAGRRP